jgi:hypothetical protein
VGLDGGCSLVDRTPFLRKGEGFARLVVYGRGVGRPIYEGVHMRKKLFTLVAVAVVALTVLAATATAGPPWKQPPRGADQATLTNCEGPTPVIFVGDTCVVALFEVPSSGEALNNGQYSLTVPPGTTLTGVNLDFILDFGANPCTWDETYNISGNTITVTGLTCPQDSAFVFFAGADVESALGTYTLSGDYKINNSKRSASNVFRYAEDPTVEVADGT